MLLGGLGLRNLICKHAVFPNKRHIISLVVSFEFFDIMPERCVAYGCHNIASLTKGISLYRIPYWDDSGQIARGRGKKWEDFIRRKRDKWLRILRSLPKDVSLASREGTAVMPISSRLSRGTLYFSTALEPYSKQSSAKCSEHTTELALGIQRRGKVCIISLVLYYVYFYIAF